jgi:hypothetical protein
MSRFASVASFSILLAFAGASQVQAQSLSGRLSVQAEGVLFQPSAIGSVFDLASSELTLGSDDFRHVRPAVEVMFRVLPRVSALAGWSSGTKEVQSTIRQGSGSQVTSLGLENALVAGIVLDLATWGEAGVWRATASAGYGQQSYSFEQRGTFPDASRPGSTLEGKFLTEGKGGLSFAGVRVERAVSNRVALTLGARYQWSEAEVSGDFRGFAPISLSGFGVSTGLRLAP